jgi:hypothetical protein
MFFTFINFTNSQKNQSTFNTITEEKGNYAYVDGKLTIKKLLVNIIDTERIYCNRALRFARKNQTDLPGYDHDIYVPYSGANERCLKDISDVFNAVRLKLSHYLKALLITS